MKTKVVAVDVYGTLIDAAQFEKERKIRRGFEKFFDKCNNNNIPIVTASDSDLEDVISDLESALKKSEFFNELFPEALKKSTLAYEVFDNFYRLVGAPKNFAYIISDYLIKPEELFVIGDTFEKDIIGAHDLGCSTLLVPEYCWKNSHFNFADLELP
ncbi:MAG: HAD hydrolase-like protein [Candidatus Pacearchaeota archaeon]|jgi:FMN phosphatase YigB (HAD superfamily)